MAKRGNDEVFVDISPDATGFETKLRKAVLPAARRLGREIATAISQGLAKQVSQGIVKGINDKAVIAAAATQGLRIGRIMRINITSQLHDITVDARVNANVHYNESTVRRQAVDAGGAFARTFRETVSAGIRDLPRARIDADIDPARRELYQLRILLKSLERNTVGVDIDANTAMAHLNEIQMRLMALRNHQEIDIRFNVRSALANLKRMQQALRNINSNSIDVARIRTNAVVASWAAVRAAAQGAIMVMLHMLPAVIPILAAVVGGVVALGPAFIAAASGVGVMYLAVSGLMGAVKALGQAQKKANTTAATAASKAASLANAQETLRTSKMSLAKAMRTVRDAQLALTQAYKDAEDAQEDLQSRIANGELAQRRAALTLEEAKQSMAEATADNSDATEMERAAAQLAYDEALQQVRDLQLQQERLREEEEKAKISGIEGSTQVTEAKRNLQDANESVASAQASVNKAMNSGDVAAMNLDSGVNTVANAMANLSPTAQDVAKYLFGIRSEFLQLRHAAEEGFLPGFVSAIETIRPYLPAFAAAIGALAAVMGDLFAQSAKALTQPFWREFGLLMLDFAEKALPMMVQTMGNFITGLVNLFLGFLPVTWSMGEGLLGMSEAFRSWSETVIYTEGFQEFVDYVIRNGGKTMDFLGAFSTAVWELGVTMSKYGEGMLDNLISAMRWLSDHGGVTVAIITAFVAAQNFRAITSFATAIVSLKALLASLTPVVKMLGVALKFMFANPIGLVILAIAALVGALVWLYNTNEGFRIWVNETFVMLKDIVSDVWNNYLKPFFMWIGNYIMGTVVPALVAFWDGTLKPILMELSNFITTQVWPLMVAFWEQLLIPLIQRFVDIMQYAWNAISPILHQLVEDFKTYALPVIQKAFSAFSTYIGVTFGIIGSVIQVLWNIFKIAFAAIAAVIVNVLFPVILGLWDYIIGPVFRLIIDIMTFFMRVGRTVFMFIADIITGTVIPVFQQMAGEVTTVWDWLTLGFKIAWGVIKVIFWYIIEVINKYVIPVFMWLWDVIKIVWDGIVLAFNIAWVIIKGVFDVIVGIITNYVVPIFTWLWDMIKIVWEGIKLAFSLAWNILRGIFEFIIEKVMWVKDKFTYGFEIIKRVFTKFKDAIVGVWEDHIKPVFETFGNFIDEKVKPAFERGIEALKKAWEKVKDIVKAPIKWVIEHPINNGVIAAINWVGGKFGLDPLKPFDTNFACGGAVSGPGTATSDSISARLSDGEHVLTARDVQAAGGQDAVYAWRASLHRPGFKDGGAVDSRIKDFIWSTDPLPYKFGAVGPRAYDCCLPARTMVHGPGGPKQICTLQSGDVIYSRTDEGELVERKVVKAWRSIDQMTYRIHLNDRYVDASDNHPFLRIVGDNTEWVRLDQLKLNDTIIVFNDGENVSSESFDTRKIIDIEKLCIEATYDINVEENHNFIADGVVVHNSGLVGEVWNRTTGNASHIRRFTTRDITNSRFGFVPGHGKFTIGLSPSHVVGNYDGLPFEAASTSSGIRIGDAAKSVNKMPKQYYYAAAGGADSEGTNKLLDFMRNPFEFMMGFVNDKLTAFKSAFANVPYAEDIAKIPGGAVNLVKDKLVNLAPDWLVKLYNNATGNGGGVADGDLSQVSGNSAIVLSWIKKALAHTGTSTGWMTSLLTLIMRESGGNPRAQNNWDINARMGHPSRGLMQLIDPTFRTYHDASLGNNIWDPIQNIVAGINYIKARYGSIFNVQQANPNASPKGYDSGGWLMPGFTSVYNGTGKPEAVFTAEQFGIFKTMADAMVYAAKSYAGDNLVTSRDEAAAPKIGEVHLHGSASTSDQSDFIRQLGFML